MEVITTLPIKSHILMSLDVENPMTAGEKFLLEAEKRFKKVAQLEGELASFPIIKNKINTQIDKEKSKEFGEVFTPLWLVDHMIKRARSLDPNSKTLDLCAGYGQFSIRLLRHLNNKFSGFNASRFIQDNHAFAELQLSSCYKLLNIFGVKINLYIGDATYVNSLPKDAKGIWCYLENHSSWVCLTKTILKILSPNGIRGKSISEDKFVLAMQALISDTKERYSNMETSFDTAQERLYVLDKLNGAINSLGHGKTSVPMPPNVVDQMLSVAGTLEQKKVLVLHNAEIVEPLIYTKNLDPKNILFGVDTTDEARAQYVKDTYGVDTCTYSDGLPRNVLNRYRFDTVLTNPNYNKGSDLKMLRNLMGNGTIENSIAREFVVVHPSTWILTTTTNSFRDIVSNKLRYVNFFNANSVFTDIDLAVPGMITHIDLAYNGSNIRVKFFNDEFVVDHIRDITKFGKDWQTIVGVFMQHISSKVAIMGHIANHKVYAENAGKYYCQLARQRGHVAQHESKLVEDDFYTLCVNDDNFNKGVRLSLHGKTKGNCAPTYEFDSEIERDNFLSYMKTDFVRFCLALAKNNLNLDDSVLKLIPWMGDYSQAWDDERLFSTFNINQDTQDYIRNFLPDYYGLRKIQSLNAAE